MGKISVILAGKRGSTISVIAELLPQISISKCKTAKGG
jgi:hypothetical protein